MYILFMIKENLCHLKSNIYPFNFKSFSMRNDSYGERYFLLYFN